MQINTAQTIFSLFYAILFGAIFTISDRWRPFTYAGQTREGRRRVILSILLLGVLPIIYFVFTFPKLSSMTLNGFFRLGIVIYLIAPLYAFYVSWAMIVSFKKDKFYSKEEQKKPPVAESLFWITERSPPIRYLLVFYIFFIIIPFFMVSWPKLWQ